jgi:hypothetical protein
MKSRVEMLNPSVSENARLMRDSAFPGVASRRGRNSMLAGILIATSATIALFLGLAHIYLTFFTRAFAARDAALEEKLKSVSPRISDQTTMWRAGVGFHASHALGVLFFGPGLWLLGPGRARLPHSVALLGRAGRPRFARLCRPGEALLVRSAVGWRRTRASLLCRRRCRRLCMKAERPQFGPSTNNVVAKRLVFQANGRDGA